jgi:energy-coupling factor transporter ATP-binding protein EcfA2
MIHFERVTYTYPHTAHPALRDINLDIDEGSFVAVIGANGAGKSTLCAALAGFIPHHFRGELQGRVIVDGLDTATTPLSELVTRVGLVFQNPFNQLSGAKLTLAEEVAFGLENLGVPREEMFARVNAALDIVGLREFANRSPYALSGGEMQRVALACILVMEPRVLVLDEPTAQLDPIGTRELFHALRALISERRCTVVLVEQKTEWIAAFADRVIALHDGAIVLDGTPRAVLTSARLDEIGIRVPRYTVAARAAREQGLWQRELELPVTFEQAVQGFQTRSGK